MLGDLLKRIFKSRELEIHALKLEEPRDWRSHYPDVPPPEHAPTVQLFLAKFACGDIHGEDTPALAADLLEAGFDFPSLRRLAGETQIRSHADAAELMERIAREAGLPVPFPIRQARLMVSRQIARRVIAGERDPWRGAVDLQGIWGWRSDAGHGAIRAILSAADDDVWDDEAQKFRPVVDSDLLDSFACLARLNDDQLFGPGERTSGS